MSELKPLEYCFDYEGEKYRLLIFRTKYRFQRLKKCKVFPGALGLLNLELNSVSYQDDFFPLAGFDCAVREVLIQQPNGRSLKARSKGVMMLLNDGKKHIEEVAIWSLKVIAGIS